MNAKNIRGWLLCQPRPVRIRILREDEQPQHIELTPGVSFSSVSESIVALAPELLEALDKDGNIIRAMRDEEPEEEAAPEDGFLVKPDAGSAQLIIFAKLIADAYKTSTVTAFDKLGELFSMVVNREQASAKAADTWQRAFMKQVMENQASGEGPGGEANFESMMMQHFMSGMAKAKAEEAAVVTNGAPVNGAAPKGTA